MFTSEIHWIVFPVVLGFLAGINLDFRKARSSFASYIAVWAGQSLLFGLLSSAFFYIFLPPVNAWDLAVYLSVLSAFNPGLWIFWKDSFRFCAKKLFRFRKMQIAPAGCRRKEKTSAPDGLRRKALLGWSLLVVVSLAGRSAQCLQVMYAEVSEPPVWVNNEHPLYPFGVRLVSPEYARAGALVGLAARNPGNVAAGIGKCSLISLPVENDGFPGKKYYYVMPTSFQETVNDRLPGFIRIDADLASWTPEGLETMRMIDPVPQIGFYYRPEAGGNYNVYRHLYNKGLWAYSFSQAHLELDDSEDPWWIISLHQPCPPYGFRGLVTVAPYSGKFRTYSYSEIPAWVDCILPEDRALEKLRLYLERFTEKTSVLTTEKVVCMRDITSSAEVAMVAEIKSGSKWLVVGRKTGQWFLSDKPPFGAARYEIASSAAN